MNKVSTEKTMTVKEVAEVLGVTPEAIKKHVRELFPECIRNGIETVLTVSQVTEIKKKMLPTTLVVGAVTEIDRQKTIMLAMQYLKEDYDKMKQRAEIAEQKCIEQQPKVDVYDAISDSSTLQDLQTVAQTIGVKNIFKILLADGIIMKEWTKDKTMFYRPYAQYNDYLVTKDGNPYKVNGVARVRPRIFVTAKGLLWLTKKYKEGK